jgi:hypothetical protein
MYIDDCQLKGVVNLVLRDKDGKVKQHKTIRNKVTNHGLAHLIGRMIDDKQDKAGAHEMPRMMSHMAVGIGASARDNPNSYELKNAVYPATKKSASEAKIYDRMLQNERGGRVQLMKDTTLASDYTPIENVALTRSTTAGSAGALFQTVGGNSVIVISTGSSHNSITTVNLLQPGNIIAFTGFIDAASGTSLSDPSSSYTNFGTNGTNGYKIKTIETDATRSETKITIDGQIDSSDLPAHFSSALPADTANLGDRTVFARVEYVGRIRNKKEVYDSAKLASTFQTHFPLNERPHLDLDSNFGTDAHPTMSTGTGNTFPEWAGQAGAANTDGTSGGLGPFLQATTPDDNDLNLLGVNRGRIGFFYQRELKQPSLLVPSQSGGSFVTSFATRVQDFSEHGETQAGFATTLTGPKANFPFGGEAENKPATTSTTEFVQFGTSVDGIFQGSSIGSSLSEDKGTRAEGYPTSENDYGVIGGLYRGASDTKFVLPDGTGSSTDTAATNHLITFNPASTYTPNSVAGGKKSGSRVVYVATFKENNPRLETDRDSKIHDLTSGLAVDHSTNNISPIDGVYPICEAGIFNKHRPDVGIFDVGDRVDGGSADSPNVDSRIGGTTTQENTYITSDSASISISGLSAPGNPTTADGVAANKIPLKADQPVLNTDGHLNAAVLTSAGQKVSANPHGFTQGASTQTMLCRTTFAAINKAVTDTLQITWSIQLQDAST